MLFFNHSYLVYACELKSSSTNSLSLSLFHFHHSSETKYLCSRERSLCGLF